MRHLFLYALQSALRFNRKLFTLSFGLTGRICSEESQQSFYLKCHNLKCHNLKRHNLKCHNLKCHNLKCHNLKCHNLKCHNFKCQNLQYKLVPVPCQMGTLNKQHPQLTRKHFLSPIIGVQRHFKKNLLFRRQGVNTPICGHVPK